MFNKSQIISGFESEGTNENCSKISPQIQPWSGIATLFCVSFIAFKWQPEYDGRDSDKASRRLSLMRILI